jgi:hypothetical protein
MPCSTLPVRDSACAEVMPEPAPAAGVRRSDPEKALHQFGMGSQGGRGSGMRPFPGDLSSRAAEQELIQLVRAKAYDADGPNLLR